MVGGPAGVRGRVFCVAAFREPGPQLFRLVQKRPRHQPRIRLLLAVATQASCRAYGEGAETRTCGEYVRWQPLSDNQTYACSL